MANNLVTVEGEFVVKDGTGVMLEFYEEEFIIDGSLQPQQVLAYIKKGLIAERLRKREGYKRVRTCKIIDIKPTSEQKEDDSELTKTLMEAIDLGCVPGNIESYKRPDYKLKALQKAIEAHKLRAKKAPKNIEKCLGDVED